MTTYGTPEPCLCGATDCKLCFPFDQKPDEETDDNNLTDSVRILCGECPAART